MVYFTLLHKTLGERIGVVPWSEPPAESLRIPWKRVKWTVTGAKDVYKIGRAHV